MPAIKILHTADLHLDSPLRSLALKDEALRDQVQTASRIALARMVQFAIDEGVAALLIAGDLYDGQERSAKTAAYLAGEMARLEAACERAVKTASFIEGMKRVAQPILALGNAAATVRAGSSSCGTWPRPSNTCTWLPWMLNTRMPGTPARLWAFFNGRRSSVQRRGQSKSARHPRQHV